VSLLRRAGATLTGFAGAALLVAGSQLPWRPYAEGTALVRLSWRSASEPVQECRVATAEELAALPPHMRREKICERRHTPFRLEARVDGQPVRELVIEPAGASGDRPLYVFEELPVSPGAHRLTVSFEEQRAGRADSPPRALRLEAALELAPREIALVTLDASGERLALSQPGR
jgi:hypothetical protein